MKKRSYYRFILAILLLAVLIVFPAGCGKQEEQLPEENDTETDAEKNDGSAESGDGLSANPDKRFTLRFTPQESLNPIYCDDVYNDAVTSLMYEGLFRLNESFKPINVLCESFETEDGLTFYFKLIEAKRHDGSLLTAADAAYSINLARNSSKYSSRLKNISGCFALEDGRLQIVLSETNYSLPALLDIPVIKDGSGSDDKPVGTGPYVYVKAGDIHILKAFEEYRSHETLPLSMIYLKEFADDNIVESFSERALDLIWEDTGGETSVNLHSSHESRLYDTAVLQYVGFNANSAVMSDVNVRKAVSSAVNRDYIVNNIFGGSGRAATLLLNPVYYLYDASWETGYGYSPAMLSANLAKSGLADKNSDGYLEYPVSGTFQTFKIRFIVNSENRKKVEAAENIAENLKQVGLNIELQILDWSDYKAALNSGRFDIYYAEVSLTKDFDFSNIIGSSGSLDYGNMGSRDYDILYGAFANATSEINKTSAGRNLCIIAAENAVIVPVMYRQYVIYTHRGIVENFKPAVSGTFSDIADWIVHMPE